MSTRIVIEAISPEQARLPVYAAPLSGDWHVCPTTGDMLIQVVASDVWDELDAFLVALHELVEARACFEAGVVEGAVDSFDLAYTGDAEPGEAPDCPYAKQHRMASLIEYAVAMMLGKWAYGGME